MAAWDATGCRVGVHRRMRLYRLAELTWPRPLPDGAPRPAVAGDVALAAWELDGTPVSLAGFTRRVAGMVRVAPVYTSIYQRIGYRPAEDRVVLSFSGQLLPAVDLAPPAPVCR